MGDQKPLKLSGLARAKRSTDITIAFTAEDVRRIRPAWSGPEAEYFLQHHKMQIAHMTLELGMAVLRKLVEMHEHEAGSDESHR